MTCHHPRNPPPDGHTVLLLHWYAEDREPLCESGCYHEEMQRYDWDNPDHWEYEVHAWMDLPLPPPEPPR